jgi:hypothetical protein
LYNIGNVRLTLTASANVGRSAKCSDPLGRAHPRGIRPPFPHRPISTVSAGPPAPLSRVSTCSPLPHLPSPAPLPRAGACAAAQDAARRALRLQGMRSAGGEVARPAGSHCADPDAREPRRRADARRSGCACGGAGLSWPLPAAVIPLVHDGARLDPWDLPACARSL